MKFLFYGASVTQQGGSSGYIHNLKELLDDSSIEISSLGYGACHLDDAGFYNINRVISECPDVCVLEWNTTGLGIFNQKKLESMIGILANNNISISFLILPRGNTNLIRNRACEELVLEICKIYKLPYLDMRKLVDFKACVRDDVHTNNFGAFEYAKNIAEWIKNTNFPKSKKEFSILEPIFINDDSFFVDEKKIIEYDLIFYESEITEVVFEITVGPSMLNLLVSIDENIIERSFVDPWCYYERPMFYTLYEELDLKPASGPSTFSIRASSNLPNYSNLLKSPASPLIKDKGISVKRVYSTGCELVNLRIKNG